MDNDQVERGGEMYGLGLALYLAGFSVVVYVSVVSVKHWVKNRRG